MMPQLRNFNMNSVRWVINFSLLLLLAFIHLTQEREFALQQSGFTAVKHQREVGTGYFDAVTTTIEQNSSTTAMKNSTETEQFH